MNICPVETSKTPRCGRFLYSGICQKQLQQRKGERSEKLNEFAGRTGWNVLIETLISAMQPNTRVIIAGENYEETASQPIVRVYLITMEDEGWVIETELQAFAFNDIESTRKFVYDLPNLSAIDILIRMKGHQSHSLYGSIAQ